MKAKRSSNVATLLLLNLLVVKLILSAVLRVPQDYMSINQAINSTFSGDTVLISVGLYNEQITVRNRSFMLAGAFLFSNDSNDIATTIIMLPDSISSSTSTVKSVIRIDNCPSVKLNGFTVRNGAGTLFNPNLENPLYRFHGGGIFADSTNLDLEFVVVRNSNAQNGGGVCNLFGNSILRNSIIDSCWGYGTNNVGGGVLFKGDTIILDNNYVSNCSHEWGVGGVFVNSVNCVLIGNTFINNFSPIASSAMLYNVSIAENNYFNGNTSNSATLWLTNESMSRNNESVLLNNYFTYNQVFQYHSNVPSTSCVYLQNSDSSNWLVMNNVYMNNVNETFVNGYVISIQRGYVTIKNNYFENNRSLSKSIMAIRQRANVTFDSNIVISNGNDRLIQLISNSRISASRNDFIGNTGAIFDIEPTSSHGYLYNNYWGHPSGPRAPGNPNGQGDSIGYWYNNNYEYLPFRTTPVFPELDVRGFGDGNDRGQNGSGMPNTVTIVKVYPNPTNSTLTVHYTINKPQLIFMRLYDTNGREVYASLPQPQVAGSHTFSLQTNGIASGLYFLKLSSPTSPTESAMQKVVLLK